MNAYYFVLWIPQTRKESPKIIKNQLDPKNLCDIETLPSFNVRGSISVAKDILLEYSIGDESFDKKLEFKFIESDNRGFVIYKLELEDQQNDFLCKLLRKEMPNAIYHYFKSFYHKHVFHEESEDSLLSAYFSPVPIKWDDKKVQSKILESLLDDYITKFEGAYELYSPRYIEIATSLNNRKGIDRQIKELKKLIIECREKYNEHLYSDFLLATFPDIKATKKRELENVIKVFETLIMNQESALSQAYAEAGFGYSVGGVLCRCIGVVCRSNKCDSQFGLNYV